MFETLRHLFNIRRLFRTWFRVFSTLPDLIRILEDSFARIQEALRHVQDSFRLFQTCLRLADGSKLAKQFKTRVVSFSRFLKTRLRPLKYCSGLCKTSPNLLKTRWDSRRLLQHFQHSSCNPVFSTTRVDLFHSSSFVLDLLRLYEHWCKPADQFKTWLDWFTLPYNYCVRSKFSKRVSGSWSLL